MRSFYSPLQRSGFLLRLEVARDAVQASKGWITSLPSPQGCARHVIYLPFLPQSHLGLDLMCFISDPR